MDLPVVRHTPVAGTAEDPAANRESVSEVEFHDFRNRVLRALRQFGSVGPMGEAPLQQSCIGPDWRVENDSPNFYVVDDMWNEQQMFAWVETAPECLTGELLAATVRLLNEVESGWAVSFALFRGGVSIGGVLLLRDRLMVAGEEFAECRWLSDVSAVCVGTAS